MRSEYLLSAQKEHLSFLGWELQVEALILWFSEVFGSTFHKRLFTRTINMDSNPQAINHSPAPSSKEIENWKAAVAAQYPKTSRPSQKGILLLLLQAIPHQIEGPSMVTRTGKLDVNFQHLGYLPLPKLHPASRTNKNGNRYNIRRVPNFLRIRKAFHPNLFQHLLIGSIQALLVFVVSGVIGPIYDRGHLRFLLLVATFYSLQSHDALPLHRLLSNTPRTRRRRRNRL